MKIISSYTISKEVDYPSSNEDCFKFSKDCIVICDGASQSFDARLWSNKVASHFSDKSIEILPEAIHEIIKDYISTIDIASLPWAKAIAFENGSFSTLMRLSSSGSRISLESIGDCLCAYTQSSGVMTFPYTAPEDFDKNPNTVSSRLEHNTNVTSKIESHSITSRKINYRSKGGHLKKRKTARYLGQQKEKQILLLMTDALGQWLCENKEQHYQRLIQVNSQHEFDELVIELRSLKEIRTDDTTLLIVKV